MPMPTTAAIEDAPHHLKLLDDYGKTAVTLALALLSLSVAFADKFLKTPVDTIQAILLIALWVSLFLALVSGLMIASRLTGVASNYMKAMRIAYPDALKVLAEQGQLAAAPDAAQPFSIDAEKKKNIATSLQISVDRTVAANWWANCSFWMFGIASLMIGFLGAYGLIYKGSRLDASLAAQSSTDYVAQHYKLQPANVRFRSLSYDDQKKIYDVEVRDSANPNDKYQIKFNSSTGEITGVQKTP